MTAWNQTVDVDVVVVALAIALRSWAMRARGVVSLALDELVIENRRVASRAEVGHA